LHLKSLEQKKQNFGRKGLFPSLYLLILSSSSLQPPFENIKYKREGKTLPIEFILI